MAGETVQFEETDKASETEKREQSTISFPYHDLDAAVEVARAAYNRSGLGSCDLDELAAEMGQVISGTFRVKVAAGRTFGLIDKDGRGAVKLTDLGRTIVTESDGAAGAKVEAFLAVPLYAKLYEAYKGQKLPPMKALEREMAALGVAAKQTDKARQAFERSAKQAGFFDAGADRLVRPKTDATIARREDDDQQRDDPPRKRNTGSGGGGYEPPTGKNHPLIQGLLVTLPEPGKAWSKVDRKAWLTMAESIFGMIYSEPSDNALPPQPSPRVDEEEDFDL